MKSNFIRRSFRAIGPLALALAFPVFAFAQASRIDPQHARRAGRRRLQIHEDLDRGRFAGAIGTKKTENLTLMYFQSQILQGLHTLATQALFKLF